jgi:hypothetical protein
MLSGCIVRQWRKRQRARVTAAKRQQFLKKQAAAVRYLTQLALSTSYQQLYAHNFVSMKQN